MDETYLYLINHVRPKKAYYHFGLGDKLLHLQEIDKIDYDIVQEERRRKAIAAEEALIKARADLEAQWLPVLYLTLIDS